MLALVELKATPLEYGITGFSVFHMLCILWMIIAIPMIPYFFLYVGLGKKPLRLAVPFHKLADLLHLAHHPHPLHH